MEKQPLLGQTPDQLKAIAAEAGLPPFAGKQMAQWLYQKGAGSIEEMTNLSKAGRERLAERFEVGLMPPMRRQCSQDGTVKYLFPTAAGATVETVFIPDADRGTLCVSCQVGCKMGCRFCMTGRQGFQGNLTVGDILNQIYALPERDRLTNIVFMGQGEPMDNLDAVLGAIGILTADYGWAWSPKRITVSTVGLRKGLKRFLDESQCHLAISMHNPFAEERGALMPAERSFPLTEVLELLRQYDWTGQRRLTFEYIVFGGNRSAAGDPAYAANHTQRHVRQLVALLKGLECRVNLIRWHVLPGETQLTEASMASMETFRDELNRHGITCTIRTSRGQDIDAACGLLKSGRG